MNMVVVGTIFVDIKGFPADVYVPGEEMPGALRRYTGEFPATWRRISRELAFIPHF